MRKHAAGTGRALRARARAFRRIGTCSTRDPGPYPPALPYSVSSQLLYLALPCMASIASLALSGVHTSLVGEGEHLDVASAHRRRRRPQLTMQTWVVLPPLPPASP